MNMTSLPVVLLLGASGQIGSLIAKQLQNSPLIELRIASRRQEQLGHLRKQYGNAVYLDLDDPRTFQTALQGVDRLFLLTGYSVSMLTQSKTLIDAAKKAGVRHLTHLGVFSKSWDCTVPHFTWHQMIEAYINRSGMQWTFLHPNCFLQNLSGFSLAKDNKFRWYTAKPCGWIALEDVADAAAKILIDGPETHHGKDYWFSTESLNLIELSKVLSDVTGKPVMPDLQSSDQFLKDMGSGSKTLDPYFYSVAESFKQIEDGRMKCIGEVHDDISRLLNRKGLSCRQWAEIHKPDLVKSLNEKGSGSIAWSQQTKA